MPEYPLYSRGSRDHIPQLRQRSIPSQVSGYQMPYTRQRTFISNNQRSVEEQSPLRRQQTLTSLKKEMQVQVPRFYLPPKLPSDKQKQMEMDDSLSICLTDEENNLVMLNYEKQQYMQPVCRKPLKESLQQLLRPKSPVEGTTFQPIILKQESQILENTEEPVKKSSKKGAGRPARSIPELQMSLDKLIEKRKAGNMSKPEKYSNRKQIAAYQTRIKKKEEMNKLLKKDPTKKFDQIAQIILLSAEEAGCKQEILQEFAHAQLQSKEFKRMILSYN